MSSSLPSAERDPKYSRNTNPLDITNAIVSFVEEILKRDGNLIFGGHPTISPLILKVAMKFSLNEINPNRIKIYQSEFFKNIISKYTKELLDLKLGKIIWTENMNNDRTQSLNQMRNRMLKDNYLHAGIFVGGMEGIEDEFEMFREFYPNNPFYLVASSGGAARLLYDEFVRYDRDWTFPWKYNYENLREELYISKIYPSLARLIINDIVIR
ncbi:MAG: hypothetical protein ACFFBH_12675 [Promethearchaeota archaeon]